MKKVTAGVGPAEKSNTVLQTTMKINYTSVTVIGIEMSTQLYESFIQ